MTHEEALNALLADSCGLLDEAAMKENGGVQFYDLELHCAGYQVQAKPLGNLKFEIVAVIRK